MKHGKREMPGGGKMYGSMPGGGKVKRRLMEYMAKGGKLKMVKNDKGEMVPFFAADGKGAKDLGRVEAKKGGKINAGLKAYLAKKKKMKKKK